MVSVFCLVVDAGHTRVKFAACQQLHPGTLPEMVDSCAVIYGDPVDWDRIAGWFLQRPPDAAIAVGTNLSRAEQILKEWPVTLPRPQLLTDKLSLPLRIDVDFPEKVGIDRLLNAIAANLLRQPDQPAITVGTGTAITIDVIDAAGAFQGGAILPGILLGAKSLHAETTTLPHVDVWELLKQEPPTVGRNTDAAIASGLYWGHLGAIRELVTRSTAWLESRSAVAPLVLLTGGASGIVAPYLLQARQINDLPLLGLASIAMGTDWKK